MSGRVLLAHGAGGRAAARLLREHVAPAVGERALRHDGAVVGALDGAVVVTTDAFVVRPLVFPGGDLGRLAVCGTVNDLLVSGARPVALTLALVLEEGLPLEVLDGVLASVREAAAEAGVEVVSGDTKVVERGRGDGIYACTTGVGVLRTGADVGPWRVRPGQAVLVSGDVGRHGVAVLAAREELGFEADVASDCASVAPAVDALFAAGVDVACLRDPTRGGLAAVLDEVAGAVGVDVRLVEADVPLHPTVRAACELLGLDPLLVASEGRVVAFVPEADAERALAAWRSLDPAAARVGTVVAGRGEVWVVDAWGGERPLDRPNGEPLPRIC